MDERWMALLRQVAAGEEGAWTDFVALARPDLLTMLLQVPMDKAIAESIATAALAQFRRLWVDPPRGKSTRRVIDELFADAAAVHSQLHRIAASLAADRDNRALVERITRKDEEAYNVVFNAMAPVVKQFALRRLKGDEHSANDIASEVMILLWGKADTFRGESTVSTWLVGVANGKIRDLLNERIHDEMDDAVVAKIDQATARDFAATADGLSKEDFERLMKRLPERCLALLLWLHRFSLAEISEELNVSVATVGRIIRKCLQQARGLL